MIRLMLWSMAGAAWTTLFVGVGLWATFPQDPVRERVEFESVKFTDKQFAVTMASVRPWWLGLSGSDVTVYSLKKGRKSKDVPKPPYERRPLMTLDALSVRAEPFSYALGKRATAFVAKLLGGAVDGRYSESEAAVDLSFEASGLDLGRLASGDGDDALHLLGVVAADADLHLDTTDVKESSGAMHLAINGFGIGAGSKAGGFGLPEAAFDRAVLTAEIHDGKLEITEGVFEGSVISAVLTGDVSLNKRLSRSRNHLDLAFSLPDEYDELAQLSPTLKRSKDEEGRYHCAISGTFVSPTFRCGGRSGKVSGGIGDRGVIGSRGGDGIDDETRKKEREARIAERRERLKKKREEAGIEDPRPLDEEPRRPFDAEDDPGNPDFRFPDGEIPVERPGDLPFEGANPIDDPGADD